jgi:hypothetical protein
MVGRRLVRYCKSLHISFSCHTDLSIRFLYTLYIAVDGNFKLKGKERHLSDVELMPGWGAYVSEGPYQTHIANYVDQPEVHIKSLFNHTYNLTEF